MYVHVTVSARISVFRKRVLFNKLIKIKAHLSLFHGLVTAPVPELEL